MTNPIEPQKVTLPAFLLRAIELVANDEQTTGQQAVAAALLISVGFALVERQTALDPTMIQIPEAQWNRIYQLLVYMRRGGVSDISRVNYGLDWMNKGPSSYHEATEAAS